MTDIPPLAFPVLIADIGGTNARFALIPDNYGDVRDFPTVLTADFPDPQSAIEAVVLSKTSTTPRSLVMALAGPLERGGVKLTNANWQIDPDALRRGLGLDEVLLLNDFEALAMALPSLSDRDLIPLGGGDPDPNAPRVVLGPGTGLGIAALVQGLHRFIPVPGEGGHMSFAAESEEDFAIWPHIERTSGRITGETLLCGAGLARLHNALAISRGETMRAREGADVTGAALASAPVAVRTMQLFSIYLGRLAGDLALLFMARGGVFIGGGIVQRHPELFDRALFRAAFQDKAPHGAIVGKIPAYLITADRPAMEGLAAFARVPNRFGVAMQARRIRADDT